MSDDTLVRLRSVAKDYKRGAETVHALDLDIPKGDFLALMGPSGSGKSTLLNLIAAPPVLSNLSAQRHSAIRQPLDGRS